MKIKSIEVSNFRKLKSTHIDFDKKTTIFVGANNSGKTSAMVALRYFLLTPSKLELRDITIANWTKIDAIGAEWEAGSSAENSVNLQDLLPALDVWLDVQLSEIRHVIHIVPTLDWKGGLIGVRMRYHFKDIDKLRAEYLLKREAVKEATIKDASGNPIHLQLWPNSLTQYLERRLGQCISLEAFALDPSAFVVPVKGVATPQTLPADAVPFEKNPFKGLIKIDEIAAQREFADAAEHVPNESDGSGGNITRFKRRLSEQLRSYYDRHLDPSITPSEADYEALGAIQTAERSFDERLSSGFAAAFKELEDLGYPGIANPKLQISTQLRAADGLKHRSSVQYKVADPGEDGAKPLHLPENYAGLGYQNLIAMVFMLMSFRDEWMRVLKASANNLEMPLEPLHLVLVEEPEAHLHAQVQQVFINKAYNLLRKHSALGENENFSTQLVVSTHSSHVAHEADFANLRYFRRRPAKCNGETPTTTVVNLSYVFGEGDDTKRFVKRYLKATHCDIFFADGIIFVEGQAERILVPHFIREHFSTLSRCYVTLLDLGGSHAHRFKDLVDELGLTTLVIADLDATTKIKVKTKRGDDVVRWKAARAEQGKGQKTANSVLKSWYPLKEFIDDLIALPPEEHKASTADGYELYVTYQKPIPNGSGTERIIPRTFEDALILENIATLSDLEGSQTSKKISEIVSSGITGAELADELFELLKSAEKAAFALECLMLPNANTIKPPQYIREGLAWFERAVGGELAQSGAGAGSA